MKADEMQLLLDDGVFAYIVNRVKFAKSSHSVTDLMHAVFGQYTSLAVDVYTPGKTKGRAKRIEKTTCIPVPVMDKIIQYLMARFCGGREYWNKRLRDYFHETTRPKKFLSHLSIYSVQQSHRNKFKVQLGDQRILSGARQMVFPHGYDLNKDLYQPSIIGDPHDCRFPLAPPDWKPTELVKEIQNRRMQVLHDEGADTDTATNPSEEGTSEKKQRK